MKVRRVFDVVGPSGVVPNGINWNFIETFWNHDFYVNHNLINDFNKKYKQIGVYDCNLNLPEDYIKNYHINDLNYDKNENLISNQINEQFFYTIHPFGNLNVCNGSETNYHQNRHAFDFISKRAKEYSNAKNFWILFDYSSEGDIRNHIFEYIHAACERNNINPSKVIVITASENTSDIYKQYLKNNPQDNLLYTAFYPWSLLAKAKDTYNILIEKKKIQFNQFENENSLIEDDELDGLTNRESHALCLNRRLAPHRIVIISWLLENNLFDKTKTSFDLSLQHNHDEIGLNLTSRNEEMGGPYLSNQDKINEILSGFRKMKKLQKNVVDTEDIEGVWGFAFEDSENYKSTYFSIVTESLFYEPGAYLSEKIWKPIQHLHPFVLVGKPNMLKFLHNLGFKTFSEFWDESYDTIEDNTIRIDKICSVLSNLLNKSKQEWDELNTKLKPILLHNRKLLLSYQESRISNTYIQNLLKLIEDEPNKENYYLLSE